MRFEVFGLRFSERRAVGVNPLVAIIDFSVFTESRNANFLSAERQMYGTPVAPPTGRGMSP